jgi:hypothetical protein
MVVVVSGLAIVIAWRRPRTSGRVLKFGCAALLVVVLYSSSLAAILEMRPQCFADEDARAIEESNRRLAAEATAIFQYRDLRRQLREDLLTQRLTLKEAAARLVQSSGVQRERWLESLREQYPGLSDEACLAANLVETVRRSLEENPPADAARRLESDFQVNYGVQITGPVRSGNRP